MDDLIPATTTQDDVDEDIPVIRANQYILIKMPSGNQKVVTLRPDSLVSLGKFGSFHANDLIGQVFGHSYEIYGRNQIRVTSNWALEEVEETDANNREIFDDSSTQKLSFLDIEKLKEEGMKGELEGKDIIQKMVDSHASFDKKTEFSKAKYIQRKQKKFMKVFTPLRPTMLSVAQYFFVKNPDKVRNMRIDTLSQILSFGNVHANSKLLVVDDTQGLVISAVAERMGGFGTILGIHDGDNHNYDILRYMNFSKHVLDSVTTLPWTKVAKDAAQEPFDYKTEEQLGNMKELDRNGYYRRKRGYEKLQAAKQSLWDGNFDGLIVASQYTAVSILETLLPYLGGSRPIVIYSIHKEALLDACVWMRKSVDCLNPQITESWLRQYQVLPGRTHPEMTTTGGAGYVLTAMRVIDFPTQAAVGMGSRRNKEVDSEDGRSVSSLGTRGTRRGGDRGRRGGWDSGGRGRGGRGVRNAKNRSEQASASALMTKGDDGEPSKRVKLDD
ncbi:Gcd10p-domain-containing protein [Jimgerdemannia flammicorona]|uniref:tRNA (adenine(58)-N(1))-methyltransferase non-catalytic subunit TRM6 n=1 Tax=Jimgerdemannia flammicorona TaxID=994334 RepID=A0A433D3G1_9FUNG|nr:Gcd10p-domain-containing protein [Jimgerdemannia flammicorona]